MCLGCVVVMPGEDCHDQQLVIAHMARQDLVSCMPWTSLHVEQLASNPAPWRVPWCTILTVFVLTACSADKWIKPFSG